VILFLKEQIYDTQVITTSVNYFCCIRKTYLSLSDATVASSTTRDDQTPLVTRFFSRAKCALDFSRKFQVFHLLGSLQPSGLCIRGLPEQISIWTITNTKKKKKIHLCDQIVLHAGNLILEVLDLRRLRSPNLIQPLEDILRRHYEWIIGMLD
jgi:hypothetical protein